jgi:CPA2 family monovalent cation:H+ antiporter-2
MRARYLLESSELVRLGAREVVAEEVESAVEIIARMLRSLDVPGTAVAESIDDVRASAASTA